MSRYTFTGDAPVTYSFYLDATDPDHVTTLVAAPGETYEIAQATGHTVPTVDGQVAEQELAMPPDDHWTETQAAKPVAKKKETD